MILVESEIVTVKTEVDVEASIAIVVGDGGMGEGSLRGLHKLEGIRFARKFASSLVQEEQRSVGANYEKILHTFVLEIGKERAGRGIQNVYS